LFGYLAHWIMHKRWSGRLYQAHYTHHQVLYPPEDMYSDKYREAGIDDSGKLFILLFLPIILVILAFGWFKVIPLWAAILTVIEMGLIGYLHDFWHEKFHLSNTWWKKFKWFQHLTQLHYIHHIETSKNLGIFNFWWDRVFKSYHGKFDE